MSTTEKVNLVTSGVLALTIWAIIAVKAWLFFRRR